MKSANFLLTSKDRLKDVYRKDRKGQLVGRKVGIWGVPVPPNKSSNNNLREKKITLKKKKHIQLNAAPTKGKFPFKESILRVKEAESKSNC